MLRRRYGVILSLTVVLSGPIVLAENCERLVHLSLQKAKVTMAAVSPAGAVCRDIAAADRKSSAVLPCDCYACPL